MSFIPNTRQKEIDRKIDEILLQSNKSYPEDGLLDIVKSLGIEVFSYDFAEYADRVSGVIKPGNDLVPTKIYINKLHSKERKTFTLAHELGHYLLHDHNSMKLRIDQYNYKINTKEAAEETEANYFAASLLMPKDKFVTVLKESGSFSAVAKYFGVSEAAARNRAKWILHN